jgi:hypothetical protein
MLLQRSGVRHPLAGLQQHALRLVVRYLLQLRHRWRISGTGQPDGGSARCHALSVPNQGD